MAGRPRDQAREAEILRVTLEVLAEHGYDKLSFEEVARRAKASKATLYRRWAGKREMVVAAIKAGPASSHHGAAAIDTGTLRGDLLALTERLNATLQASDGSMSLMLLQAGLEDAELCEYLETATGPTGARLPDSILQAAIQRGELPAHASPFSYEEVAGAALLLRKLNGLRTDRAYLEQLIDAVLIPALQTKHELPPHAAPGIFSGAPKTAQATH
ncbi:TetR family transcriptional regulator [Psychromicrobium lacuslunae]|uniref:TetR family transcriptional regulator n=1 Tax=Psychromicrobium lacuslunae TaxID=1618207 RepID=A0A0D4C3A7_9MICC|nr:TetR family transcriptional regulator [Psychromicrobium lacuslunae]